MQITLKKLRRLIREEVSKMNRYVIGFREQSPTSNNAYDFAKYVAHIDFQKYLKNPGLDLPEDDWNDEIYDALEILEIDIDEFQNEFNMLFS